MIPCGTRGAAGRPTPRGARENCPRKILRSIQPWRANVLTPAPEFFPRLKFSGSLQSKNEVCTVSKLPHQKVGTRFYPVPATLRCFGFISFDCIFVLRQFGGN